MGKTFGLNAEVIEEGMVFAPSSGQLPGICEIESHRNREVPVGADAGAHQVVGSPPAETPAETDAD